MALQGNGRKIAGNLSGELAGDRGSQMRREYRKSGDFSRAYKKELEKLSGDRGGKKILLLHREDVEFVAAKPEELVDLDENPHENCKIRRK